jgi:hypothetical protein
MPASIPDVWQHPEFVGSRNHTDAAFLDGGGVKVDDGGDHRVVVMWEVRCILMHWEGGALLRWLDEHFGVMELDIWAADTVGGAAGEAVIQK